VDIDAEAPVPQFCKTALGGVAMIETRRDIKTGDIIVDAKGFSVVISENSVTVRVAGEIVNEWKQTLAVNPDTPSPRARAAASRRRGSR
jgi:hypothetical protein